jgi:hypothetical protein
MPPPEPLPYLVAQPIPLDVLFEDAHLIVINKPAGLTVHPAPGNRDGTLVNGLLHHCPDLPGIGGEMRPGIVHRLDKDTTGCIVIAKSQEALVKLQLQIQQRIASREYLAVVHGAPYGDAGTMAIHRDTWTVYDPKGVEVSQGTSSVAGTGDASHIGNFLDAVRGTAELNSPIDVGQRSTRLCHLGNLAYRTGTVVRCDPATGAILDNPAAEALIGRERYRDGWEVRA